MPSEVSHREQNIDIIFKIFVRTKDFLKGRHMDDTCWLSDRCFIIHGNWITHLLVYHLCDLHPPQRMIILQAMIEGAVAYRDGNILLDLLHIDFWCKTLDIKPLIPFVAIVISVCSWGF